MSIELIETNPEAPDALELIGELSIRLKQITGSSGSKNFTAESVQPGRGVFVVAYRDGQPCGCGAVRPLDEAGSADVCEIKRMYARFPGAGIGSLILQKLEQHAVAMGYREAWLETRRVNTVAVNFYKRHGYVERENYGVYAGRPEPVCFEKGLI
jgi:ribosomal protein S18 acetylase RimI-like enzyme